MKLSRLWGSGLAGSIGAYAVGNAAQLALQLAAVPIFSYCWGLEDYGIWLILFTLPGYLAMGDFGLLAAGSNRMLASVTQGRLDDANSDYQAIRLVVWVMTIFVLAALAMGFILAGDELQHLVGGRKDAALTIGCLALYGLANLHSLGLMAGLKAGGHFALATRINAAITLYEACGAFAAALLGGGFAGAALAYAAGRCIGVAVLWLVLRSNTPWLGNWRLADGIVALRSLWRQAVAAAITPLGDLISLQGMVTVIGAAAGPSAVPAFTATRTLSRIALQMVSMVNTASLPDFTAAHARGDLRRQSELVSLSAAALFVILLPLSLALVLGGPQLLSLWSDGVIAGDRVLILAIVTSMGLHACWRTLSGFLVALNEHLRFAPFFLATAALSLPLGYFLASRWGAIGGAVAMLAAELTMVLLVPIQAKRLGLLQPEWISRSAVEATTMARRFLG